MVDSSRMTASAFTLSGSLVGAGVGQAARWSLEDRARAAAEAGYAGIGMFEADYAAMRAKGTPDAELVSVLDRHGMHVDEIEFLFDWAYDDERRDAARSLSNNLYRMAEVFQPHRLNVGDVNPPDQLPDMSVVAARFGAICDRVAPFGVNVAFEFLPWTGVPDIATAAEIVDRAGRQNAGIILDVWHYFRGPSTIQQLRALPPDKVVAVALSDAGPASGDPVEDTTRRRLLPGEGTFALVELLQELRDMQVSCPVSVEILSEHQATLRPDEAARTSYEAALRVLREAGVAHN